MLDAIFCGSSGIPSFPYFVHQGRRCLTPAPSSYSNVTSITSSNGVVVRTDCGNYDSSDILPQMLRHDLTGTQQWLSTSRGSGGTGNVYFTTPRPVKLKAIRLIGYNNSNTSRGSFQNGTLQYKDRVTGEWKILYNIGTLGHGADTGVIQLKMRVSATEFRINMTSVLHNKNYYVGMRRCWLYA